MIFSPIISDKNNYAAASIDKENRLKSIKSPKIVIIGGSGSAYSIDSQALEDSLKTPTVNMALSYGLGLTFMLNEVKNQLNKGDKVIIIPEYNLPLEGNKKLLTLVNDINPNAKYFFGFDALDWLKFTIYNFQRVGSSLFYKIKNADKFEPTSIRTAFNDHGDMVAHLDMPNKRPLKDKEKLFNNLYNNELAEINQFVELATKAGAITYFSFPCYPKSEFSANQQAIKFFENRIKSNFKGNILNGAEDNLYEEEDFFDTVYHLNRTGRAKRTNYFVKTLKGLQ